MLFGRDYATPVSLCLRLALLVLPVLHAAMWSTRFVRDISKLSNPKYRLAIIARGTLAVVSICQVRACDVMTHRTVECHSCRHTHRPSRVAEARGAHVAWSVTAECGRCRSGIALQVVFLLFHNFNGIQGNLAGFWMAALFAAIWESLIATYDLRGQGRQLVYLIIFILL